MGRAENEDARNKELEEEGLKEIQRGGGGAEGDKAKVEEGKPGRVKPFGETLGPGKDGDPPPDPPVGGGN